MSRSSECPAGIQSEIDLVVDQVQHVQVIFEMTTCAIAKARKQSISLSQQFTHRFYPP
jgi:hypothetical protein